MNWLIVISYIIFVRSLMVLIFKRRNMVITMGMVSMANIMAMANVMVMAMAMENIK